MKVHPPEVQIREDEFSGEEIPFVLCLYYVLIMYLFVLCTNIKNKARVVAQILLPDNL